MKKIFLALAIIIAVCLALYFYAYKGHRDIASEEADFTISTKQLQSEFAADAEAANSRYADKTLLVSGTVTEIDEASATLLLDNVLSATFDKGIPKTAKGQSITVKSRFVGYDDLLEELRTDQASVAE